MPLRTSSNIWVYMHFKENMNSQLRNNMKIWSRKEKALPSFSHFLGWNKLWLKDSFSLLQRQQDFSPAQICITWDVTQWDYDWNQVRVRILQLCLCVWKETKCYHDKDTIQPQMHHMETQQPLILMGCYRVFFHITIIPHQCLLATPWAWTGLWWLFITMIIKKSI